MVGKDLKKNILVVSQDPLLIKEGVGGGNAKNHHPAPQGTPPQKGGDVIQIENTNWINKKPEENKIYQCQTRYHGELLSCKTKYATPSVAQVIFKKPILVAPGQSLVLYDREIVLGGGVAV